MSKSASSIDVGPMRDTKSKRVSSEGLNKVLVLTGSVLSPRINSSECEDLCLFFLTWFWISTTSGWTVSKSFASTSLTCETLPSESE